MTVPHAPSRDVAVPPADRILVSEAVAAELCSVSLPTFRKWMQAGLIDRVALPGGLRRNLYRRADVEAFAERLAVHK
jgi:predicted site-specific integrase-resolvase